MTNLGAHSLAKALQHNSSLTAFDVSDNPKIGSAGFQALLHAAQRNSTLCTLTLPLARDPPVKPPAAAAPAAGSTPAAGAGTSAAALASAGASGESKTGTTRPSLVAPPPPKPMPKGGTLRGPLSLLAISEGSGSGAAAAAPPAPAPAPPSLDKTALSILSCVYLASLKPMSQTLGVNPQPSAAPPSK
jgi:hypothetical protein